MKKCPCIAEPFEECYCNHMSSQNVENILKYCNGRYTLCDIFLKRIEEIKRFYPAVLNDAALGAS